MDIVSTKAIIGKRCYEIDLSGNNISPIGVSKLVRGLKSTQALQGLHLEESEFYNEGVEILANALSNKSSVEWLYLGGNRITDAGVQYLADMFKTNKTLTHLCLNRNRIADRGVQNLCDSLIKSSSPLQKLDLSNNTCITDESVKHLCKIIARLSFLKELVIKQCSLRECGIKKLQDAVDDREQEDQWKITLLT